jgi:hypothetical protein
MHHSVHPVLKKCVASSEIYSLLVLQSIRALMLSLVETRKVDSSNVTSNVLF